MLHFAFSPYMLYTSFCFRNLLLSFICVIRIKFLHIYFSLHFILIQKTTYFSYSFKKRKSHQDAKASWSLDAQDADFCEVKYDLRCTTIL